MVGDAGAGAGADSGLAQRLRTLRQQQHDLLVGVVCSQAATVLGHPSPDHIDPERTFQDLGFDSVKATELVDRLNTVTELAFAAHPGLRLSHPGRVGHPPGPAAERVGFGGSHRWRRRCG